MVRVDLCAAALFGAVAWATADEKPAPPKKGSTWPVVAVLAKVTEADGKVVVRFSIPVEVSDGAYPVGPKGELVIGANSKMGWFDIHLVADGKKVRALTADGKAVEPKDLPKRLAKVSRVVLFKGEADPDPYYLGLFREDVVLIVAPADKFQIP